VLVPITSSFELYHALEDNGVEVKLVAYPGGGHWPSDPVQFRDLWRRWIGWVDRHFGGGIDRRSTETPASVTPR
jgi:dipeptidyl aminopeptidase/acylaminoacyl peptidase